MSACMILEPSNWTLRAVNPAAKQGLFAVGYEATGSTR